MMKEKLSRHKKLYVTISIIVVVAIILLFLWSGIQNSRANRMASLGMQETAQVERRTLVDSISATGTVTSGASDSVKAEVTGVKVTEVYVKVGDAVKEGDVICILDSTDIEEDLANAQASLNATSRKTEIDLSSAQRSLNDAQTSRNIEVERINQDVADAWSDYAKAQSDLEEAEDKYDDAKSVRKKYEKEYKYRKQMADEAGQKLGQGSSEDEISRIQSEFDNTVNELKDYISGCGGVTAKDGVYDNLSIANSSLQNYGWDDIVNFVNSISDSGEGEQRIRETVTTYLESLKSLQKRYQEAEEAEAAYQAAQTEYQSLLAEANEWEQKYNTAKNEENSMKTAYEQAVTAADNKLAAYNQKVRSQEDTVRNNDSTVNSRRDSLETTQLNASTSGQTDRKQVKQYEEQLAACTVTAPMNGIITELSVETGDTYSSNSSLAVIEDISSYEITTEIDEYDIGKVRVGQKAVIKTNGTGDLELQGTVKEIAPRASAGNGDVTYTVAVSVDTACDDLRLDMTAKLSIILESRSDVLTVPYDSVMEDEDGNFYIEVIQGTASPVPGAGDDIVIPQRGNRGDRQEAGQSAGQVERIYVIKGIESDYYVEVSGENVQEGMTVIVPKTAEDTSDIQNMMNRMGPMGGF
ncbi:MAG: efflux RND transporter periplasmic adaptor subunit [Muribaculum sp.]|nr:efflux RND transporter periplasmic adaptor subunit [Muribaculum sp.]